MDTSSDSKEKETFWVENPCSIFKSLSLIPFCWMSRNQRLNSLTRLVILICFLMALYGLDTRVYITFIVIALAIIITCYYSNGDADYTENYTNIADVDLPSTDLDDEYSSPESVGIENFTRTPTYMSDDLIQTTVSPLYSEEWQLNPPAYEVVSNVGDLPTYGEKYSLNPPRAPYRQYLTRTNMLPADENKVHLMTGGTTRAREYFNNSFVRHRIANQENMSRIFKKKLQSRFRHYNGYDTVSPYYSY